MKFGSQQEFVSWFGDEISRKFGYRSSFIAPSEYQNAAQEILKRINWRIEVITPYPWQGVSKYGVKIWERNHNHLLSSTGYNQSAGANNFSSGGYKQSSSTSNSYNSASSSSKGTTVSESGIIKRHNFESSLNKIQAFSNNVPCIPEFDKFETDGGLFGWGDHHINGCEMNRYVEKVQDLFRSHNDVILKTIQEFREVYNTFDYLDREYIQGILQTANAAKKASEGAKAASDQAKVSSDQAKAAAEKALKNEADIQKDVENLRKLVEKIKSIKEDLSSKILVLESKLDRSINELRNDIKKGALSYEERQMITKMGDIYGKTKHLTDLDDLWTLVEIHEKTIDDIKKNGINEQLRNNSSEELSQQLLSQEKQYRRNLIWAYAIGGMGLIVSICSLIF